MTDKLQSLLVAGRDDGDLGIAFKRAVEVIEFAIHLGGKGGLGEGFGNGFGNIGRAGPVLILSLRSIG